MNSNKDKHLQQWQILCWASVLEGTTLLLLLGIAVPLKHIADIPQAVSLLGPIHGIAFITYLWLAINLAGQENWETSQLLRIIGAAFIPYGGFMTARYIRKRLATQVISS